MNRSQDHIDLYSSAGIPSRLVSGHWQSLLFLSFAATAATVTFAVNALGDYGGGFGSSCWHGCVSWWSFYVAMSWGGDGSAKAKAVLLQS
nr:unnamed protein product [Digitaria exilis]